MGRTKRHAPEVAEEEADLDLEREQEREPAINGAKISPSEFSTSNEVHETAMGVIQLARAGTAPSGSHRPKDGGEPVLKSTPQR